MTNLVHLLRTIAINDIFESDWQCHVIHCIHSIYIMWSKISDVIRHWPDSYHYQNYRNLLDLEKSIRHQVFLFAPQRLEPSRMLFQLPVNASICLSNTKPHCVTNLRASTQRCALRVLELLRLLLMCDYWYSPVYQHKTCQPKVVRLLQIVISRVYVNLLEGISSSSSIIIIRSVLVLS